MSRQVWIVLVAVFLALAAVLLVTQLEPATVPARAQEELLAAASTARAAESTSSLASVPEEARANAPIVPATKDDVPAATDDSELADATWISGRVAWPESTPLDEELWVVAKGRKFEKRPLHKVRVASDGRFRVAFAKKTKGATLALESHYLYLPEPVSVALATPPEDLVLQPKVGGRVRGTCTVLLGRKDLLERARGAAVQLYGWDEFTRESTNESQRATKLDESLAFDVGGLLPNFVYNFDVRPKDMALVERDQLKIEAGKTLELELELHEGARVSGRTIDEHGEPLASAGLGFAYPRRSEWSPATSGKDGTFALTGLAAGELTLRARKTGFRDARRALGELKDGDALEGVDLVLERGLSIRGRVQWPDGTPAAEAFVSARLSDDAKGFTRSKDGQRVGADGSFEIQGLNEATYELRASARRASDSNADAADASPSSSPTEASASAAPAGTKSKPPRARGPTWTATLDGISGGAQNVVLTLGSGLALPLRVVDEVGGPVTKVALAALPVGEHAWERDHRRRQSRTLESADGHYVFEGLSEGRWGLTAVADRLSSGEETVELPQTSGELVLVVPRACVLSGRVVDAAGRPPLNARVRRVEKSNGVLNFGAESERKGSQWAECDSDGRFVFDHIAAGSSKFVASAPGAAESTEVAATAVHGVPGELTLVLRVGGTVRGVVLDHEGRPDAGRQLHAWCQDGAGRSLQATSDAAGRFELEHVAPGRWTLNLQPRDSASADEHAWIVDNATQTIEVADGQTVEVQFGGVDKDALALRGRVTRAGKALAGVRVHAWLMEKSDRPRSASGRSSDGGTYELSLPSAGAWNLNYTDTSGASLSRRVDVPAGASFTLDIDFPTGTLRGRLVDRAGAGVADQMLSVELPQGTPRDGGDVSGARAQSGDDGSFAFQSLAPGRYDVVVGSRWGHSGEPRFGGARRSDVIVPEKGEAEPVVIVLERAGKVTGSVSGIDAAPLEGAEVVIEPVDARSALTGSRTQSDAGGKFTLNGLSPGDYRVRAAHELDVTRAPQRVEVRSGEKTEVQLSLQRGGSIVVTALDGDGRRVGASCRFVDERGEDVSPLGGSESVPDPAGGDPSWRYRGFPPGRYRVQSANRAGVEASAQVLVTSGADTTVVLQFGSAPR